MAASDDPASGAGVHVEGVGTARAVPDVLRFAVGVEASGTGVQGALDAANAAARRVLDALRERGVAETDVQTANLQLDQRYDRDGRPTEGFVARQDLAVTLRDLDAAGDAIGAAVTAGGDAARLHGLTFELEDAAAAQAQARDAAFADARRKAEQYAQLAGRDLGAIRSVREQAVPGPVRFAMAEMAMASGGGVPLAAGSTGVRVSVQVRWALD